MKKIFILREFANSILTLLNNRSSNYKSVIKKRITSDMNNYLYCPFWMFWLHRWKIKLENVPNIIIEDLTMGKPFRYYHIRVKIDLVQRNLNQCRLRWATWKMRLSYPLFLPMYSNTSFHVFIPNFSRRWTNSSSVLFSPSSSLNLSSCSSVGTSSGCEEPFQTSHYSMGL